MDPGCTGQSLHKFPRFSANKPLGRLIKERISSRYINDNITVSILDELFGLDVSKVYSERAIKVVRHFASMCNALNLEDALHVPSVRNSSSRGVGKRTI